MSITILPVLSRMADFYRQPLAPARFQAYLKMLQGNSKDDMALPIMGYNPMAKGHVLTKVEELLSLDAEKLAIDALAELVREWPKDTPAFEVVLNLADDLKGGWTDHYATDYDSKFKLNAVAERGFCTPYFWSSETYDQELIRERVTAAACRTLYWHHHGRLRSLGDHVSQEIFVAQHTHKPKAAVLDPAEQEQMDEFVRTHWDTDDYALIFNFFYGDVASERLGYATYGMREQAGFAYASSKQAAD